MTDPHPFFRFVWRANALIVFAGVGLAALVAAATVLIPWANSAFRSARRGIETPVAAPGRDPAGAPAPTLHVGTFTRADGAVFHAPVVDSRRDDAYLSLSSIKGGRARVHNVVIFDAGTGAVTRLFPDDKGRILDEDVVTRTSAETARGRTVARLYVYVPADSNGDGRLDASDRQRVVVTRPDGSQPQVVAEDVERYLAAGPAEPGEMSLAYFVRRGDELLYGEFDLQRFKPGRTVPVAVPRT